MLDWLTPERFDRFHRFVSLIAMMIFWVPSSVVWIVMGIVHFELVYYVLVGLSLPLAILFTLIGIPATVIGITRADLAESLSGIHSLADGIFFGVLLYAERILGVHLPKVIVLVYPAFALVLAVTCVRLEIQAARKSR